ncbi:hypothetical protein R5W24_006082 [Gemmata sp. JC717]|uniref:hypothetical protein n=1 Tax=Gemmata algarum TaxID=2975278 RepID=UPI0021BB9AA6|nr:hypothetical protein [Gemmata algarum]MDY3556908.1 hypothetical protein [Gemmata algarum]
MAKAKIKFDPKDFLLKKGEYLVMGVAGFCLVVLLLWGVSKWGSAKDPTDIASKLAQSANSLTQKIQNDTASPKDLEEIQPPPFITKPPINRPARINDFPIQVPLFDPTAQPNTKRENPFVLTIGEYQVDLTRSAMPGYDIIYNNDNEPLIAVLATKVKSELDRTKIQQAADALKRKAINGKKVTKQPQQPQPGGQFGPGGAPGQFGPGGAPGQFGPGGSPGQFGAGGPGRGGEGAMPGSMPGSPFGMPGGMYDNNSRRNDEGRVLTYVPLADIDKALADGKPPALTVIPVRLVTIHAAVPYKQQLDEIKRALRLPSPVPIPDGKGGFRNQAELDAAEAEARRWAWYDGFDIQRRETQVMSDGTERVIQEWGELVPKDNRSDFNYKFEEKYIEKIHTRAIGHHYDEGFLPYFLKPEMMLSMPLPLLAPDLKVKYPDIRLKSITDNIKKLEDAAKPKVTASELAKKLQGETGRIGLYSGSVNTTGSFGIGGEQFGGVSSPGAMPGGSPGAMPGGPMGIRPGPGSMPGGPPLPSGSSGSGSMPGGPGGPGGFGFGAGGPPPVEVENFLLRFVDCDVQPGRTYQYRVRLKMLNPNYQQDKQVADPAAAKVQVLYSKWKPLNVSITVPAESFLYAHDTKAYREHTETEYAGQKELLKRLQLQDHQAVVQMATWMEQVRTEAGGKREPVGAWVMAEMPVGRGEYIGRKQFVKLPLWSSESQPPQYVLREVPEKIVPAKGKEAPQPKGWLVDFSTKSILVDFEGGRVKNRFNARFDDKGNLMNQTRVVDEDAATEMLIVHPNGTLQVRNSRADEGDENRANITSKWTDWLKTVESRKTAGPGGMGDENNPFGPKRQP